MEMHEGPAGMEWEVSETILVLDFGSFGFWIFASEANDDIQTILLSPLISGLHLPFFSSIGIGYHLAVYYFLFYDTMASVKLFAAQRL